MPSSELYLKSLQSAFQRFVLGIFSTGIAPELFRFIFAAKNRTAAVDRSFRESVTTFRRMSLSEMNSVRPMRIKVVTVGANDTVERLAHRMAIKDRAAERFRVLNGLAAGDKVRPGDRVKIVVE